MINWLAQQLGDLVGRILGFALVLALVGSLYAIFGNWWIPGIAFVVLGGILDAVLKQRNVTSVSSTHDAVVFDNKGTSTRETDVAGILNTHLPGGIVDGVRFARLGGQLVAYVDLAGGKALGGYAIDPGGTAQQQADAVMRQLKAQLSM